MHEYKMKRNSRGKAINFIFPRFVAQQQTQE
jgi:hypothetical protein